MKDIKTYIEKEVKLLNTQSGGGRELTHFGKGAKHAFLKVLDKIKELEAVNDIEVVEPTELRKEFENDIQKGDMVEVIYETLFSSFDKGFQFMVRESLDRYVSFMDGIEEKWILKSNVKKLH